MAGRVISCSISELGNDISVIRSDHDMIMKFKQELINSVNDLNSMWSGTAHDAFADAFRNGCNTIDEACRIISDLTESMENARKEYADCEEHIRLYINSITL